MKAYIIGIALFFIFMIFTTYQYEYNLHQEQVFNLKFVVEEAAAGAAQYIMLDQYQNGYLVFNREESIEAVEYILYKNLKLTTELSPGINSYWESRILYEISFFDDSNTNFPYLYEDILNQLTITITDPSVLVIVNAGKPRYKLIGNLPDVISVAVHEWKER